MCVTRRRAPALWTLGLTLYVVLQSTGCWGLSAEEKRRIRVYEQSAAGVVNIRSVVVRYGSFFEPLPVQGSGTGVVIGNKGHILTNAHVILDARAIEITLSDGSQWLADVVGVKPKHDLAVIRIDAPPERLQPIPLGRSEDLSVGQKVLAIGNPFGFQQTLTEGIISSLRRSIMTPDGVQLEELIQTDAAINPGNSGGPLLDFEGRLVGLNTAIFSPSGGSVGVGFAIPVETVRQNLPDLMREGDLNWLDGVLLLLGGFALAFIVVMLTRGRPRW